MTLSDYSKWLTPERLDAEEQLWADSALRTWPTFVAGIERLRSQAPIRSIVEFGCGTGWVPAALPAGISYMGLDANEGCIVAARRRNPNRVFVLADIRDLFPVTPLSVGVCDLACAFSVLKHFALHEWDAIVARVLGCGRYGLFSMPIGVETVDDGTEFPHVRVTQNRLEAAVNGAGHMILWMEPLPWGETLVATA